MVGGPRRTGLTSHVDSHAKGYTAIYVEVVDMSPWERNHGPDTRYTCFSVAPAFAVAILVQTPIWVDKATRDYGVVVVSTRLQLETRFRGQTTWG